MTRSVFVAELFVASMASDYASTLKLTPDTISGSILPLAIYSDSKSLYNVIVGMNRTNEKRLLIDHCLLR